jgi:hypothetical protein
MSLIPLSVNFLFFKYPYLMVWGMASCPVSRLITGLSFFFGEGDNMDDLMTFLNEGGTLMIGKQKGRGLITVATEIDGQTYHKGVYFNNVTHLQLVIPTVSREGLKGIRALKERLADDNEG